MAAIVNQVNIDRMAGSSRGSRVSKTTTTTTTSRLPVVWLLVALVLQVCLRAPQLANSIEPNEQQQQQQRRRHHQLHGLMSDFDLRRTFQVESHDQVPEYEILKFRLHADGTHSISPISDLGELTAPATVDEADEPDVARSQHQHQHQHHEATSRAVGDTDRSHKVEAEAEAETEAEAGVGAHKLRHKRAATGGDSGDDAADAADEAATGDMSNETKTRTTRANTRDAKQQPTAAHDEAGAAADEVEPARLIEMNLSTFGRQFRLRLKRNADFQQRIKDMKMFMAESTGDGQLRYTEIKQQQLAHNSNKHAQEPPHKRAVAADETTTTTTTSTTTPVAAGHQDQQDQQGQQQRRRPDKAKLDGGQQQQHHWNIGSTYHDEKNLAALLIERDHLTGQLQVDGTIGNDFVIKPLPQATVEALAEKQLLEKQQQQALSTSTNTTTTKSRAERPAPSASASALVGANATSGPGVELEKLAAHLHDDDPHDDDEMFLDEDEALELAHLQATVQIESNHTSTTPGALPGADPHQQLPQKQQQQQQQAQLAPKQLSKAASERKWKKYRKLMAQTQVPKLHHQQHQQLTSDQNRLDHDEASSSSSSAPQPSSSRARRHAPSSAAQPGRRVVRLSHHIVYRQKPSSEASTSEHKHSFMWAPGQQSMEEMALRFASRRQDDAHEHQDEDEDHLAPMIDQRLATGSSSGRLAAAASLDAPARQHSGPTEHQNQDQDLHLNEVDEGEEADFAADPLGGQFYLEPGVVMGTGRAGHADWSLMSRRAGPMAAAAGLSLAPYEQQVGGNSSLPDARYDHYQELRANNRTSIEPSNNSTLAASRGRFKRHASSSRGPRAQLGARARTATANRPNRRTKRQAPDTVWPEVLLVVDYDSFLLHNGDSRDVKRYFVSFWNGVDLRYKLLVHPHIRISLAGMIVAKDRDATPYLERNRLRAPNADAVDAAGALTDMGKYLYREDRLPTYDLAVVITKLDMCRRRFEGGRCNRGTAGFAYVGGACVVNKRLEKVNSVAIIEDSGGFSGIIVAAHEVGHLLGCVHDGSPPPSYLGGPGATHCPWEEGFIMSDLRHTERGFRWSQCSVEQFKHFLNGETATCLYNYPHESQMLHRLLPGNMLSLDEQCKRDRGTNACFKDARVCAQLFCFDSASGYCVSYRPAAEGSPCGEGQICRNGKCVGENLENIIPDYTHQSQTVVAAGLRAPPAVARGLVGGPIAASSSAPVGARPIGRLAADTGLSASSTSTLAATSSPDSSGPKSSQESAGSSAGPQQQQQQLSSRMDTFPIDTPTSQATAAAVTSNPYHPGLQLGQTRAQTSGPQPNNNWRQQQLMVPTASHNHNNNQRHLYQQRSGQLVTGVANSNSNKNQKRYPQQQQQHQQHQTATTELAGGQQRPLAGMQTSASSMAQYQYPISTNGNYQSQSSNFNGKQTSNLLAPTTPTSLASSASLQPSQQQQQHYDIQRLVYAGQQQPNYKSNANSPLTRVSSGQYQYHPDGQQQQQQATSSYLSSGPYSVPYGAHQGNADSTVRSSTTSSDLYAAYSGSSSPRISHKQQRAAVLVAA